MRPLGPNTKCIPSMRISLLSGMVMVPFILTGLLLSPKPAPKVAGGCPGGKCGIGIGGCGVVRAAAKT